MPSLADTRTVQDTVNAIQVASLKELLKFDGLAHAEKITGKNYKDDDETYYIGHGFFIESNRCKQILLTQMGDTGFTNRLEDYLRIAGTLGFETIKIFDFKGRSYSGESPPDEKLFIMTQNEFGILLCFDTYRGKDINGGKFYYNWKPHDKLNYSYDCLSSGGWEKQTDEDYVWAGDHDCRQALVHNITQLSKEGNFIKSWVKQPFLWLLGYTECEQDREAPDYNYADDFNKRTAVIQERAKLCPGWANPKES